MERRCPSDAKAVHDLPESVAQKNFPQTADSYEKNHVEYRLLPGEALRGFLFCGELPIAMR